MVDRLKIISPLIDIGGYRLFLLRLLDKLLVRDASSSYIYQVLKKANPEEYPRLLKDLYRIYTGADLNLDKPKFFNEKIQWLKINDCTSVKTELTDKCTVREWVRKKIGESYLTPILGVWNSFEDIDFDQLPNAFFLKCNHGSGFNLAVKDKNAIDKYAIKRQFDEWMGYNFAYRFLEMQYRDIIPKIIAEEYIEQADRNLIDYKIHVFNGMPKIIQVIANRNLRNHMAKECFLTTEWIINEPYRHTFSGYGVIPERPSNLNEMLDIARILGEDFNYVRVDLYNLDGQIKFGEMTFTPAAGYEPWDVEFQELLGSWIDLSKP